MFEINLVPDVKAEMIKAQKMRNLILFICIVVSGAAVAIVLLLFSIKAGQDVIAANQQSRIDTMSKKLNSYESLDEFLTIQDQLDGLLTISEKKTVASRVFNILDSVLPKEGDIVTISNLSLDLTNSILTIEGQADAGKEPFIDYRVLESLKKSVGLITYAYGTYVDAEGNAIPDTCITETDDEGNMLMEDGSYYVEWSKSKKGCDPSASDSTTTTGTKSGEMVKIYRTPQYAEWSQKGYLKDNGEISGVAHFESDCIKYTKDGSKWTEDYICKLAENGMTVTSSSNGRASEDNLVLRFSGTIQVEPDVFLFQNKNILFKGPEGQNVTDSYLQVSGMFAQRASDCAKDDTACQSAENSGSSTNSNSSNNSSTGSGTNTSNTTKGNQ